MTTCIKNSRVWTDHGFQRLDILFDRDMITGVAPQLTPPPDAAIVDAAGKYVLPGLIECHAHLCMNGGNSPVSVMHGMSYDQRLFECIRSMKRLLSVGITTVRDCGSLDNEVISLRNAVNSGLFTGPRIVACGMALKMTGGHFSGLLVDSPDEARKAARTMLQAGADFIKLIGTGGLGSEGVEPGEPQLNADEMKAAIYEGEKRGKASAVHCHGKQGILNALAAGATSIEHCSYIDDEIIEQLLEHDAYIVPTFTPYTKIAAAGPKPGTWVTPFVAESARKVNEHKLAQFEKAYQAGVKIAFGRDAGATYVMHEDYIFEMHEMERGGMSRAEIINAATVNAADCLYMKHKAGAIAEGKFADILIVDADPLEDLDNLSQIAYIIKGGDFIPPKTVKM